MTARRVMRSMRALLPPWLVPVVTAALLIPGPIDDAFVGIVVLAVLIFQPYRLPRAASAWRGGKSHRLFDLERSA